MCRIFQFRVLDVKVKPIHDTALNRAVFYIIKTNIVILYIVIQYLKNVTSNVYNISFIGFKNTCNIIQFKYLLSLILNDFDFINK